MKYRMLLVKLSILFSAAAFGQSVVPDSLMLMFDRQLSAFPQEKIHLHFDKPQYISGERIWFRAYITDAVSHAPSPVSRYLYVELISPLDSIVSRVKIQQEDYRYHGHILIPDDLPEGDYTVRAYTTFMLSLEEEYFFSRHIRIIDPQARSVHVDSEFSFDGRRANVKFSFSHVSPPGAIVPQSARVKIGDGRFSNLRIDSDGTANYSFNLNVAANNSALLLEVVPFNAPYLKYIQIPSPEDDFDVSFFPEGGQLLTGTPCKMAFKAVKSNGLSANITGVILDNEGNIVSEFKSDHLGMGSITHTHEKGKTYHAVCTNENGDTKRIDLPTALDYGYALSISQIRNRIHITVLKPAEAVINDELYIVMHTRGEAHFAGLWDNQRNIMLFYREQIPSGVLHIILLDANLNPISERLMFINNNEEHANVDYNADRASFSSRSIVRNIVALTDYEGTPLFGDFSVSVTSDREVTPDSTTNILTNLLLTSDLRGFIENPAFYFKNTTASDYALDLLMRTQGWRRYDIAELVQGRFSRPTSPLEIGVEFSGTVQSVLLGRPVADVDVSIMSTDGRFLDVAKTDEDGRFYFQGGDLPDSTRFVVQAIPRSGLTRMEVILDEQIFPDRTLPVIVPSSEMDRLQIARLADKADQQFTNEFGMRTYQLTELAITATRRPPRRSTFYSSANRSMTEDELERFPASDVKMILMRLGVMVSGDVISIRGQGTPLLVVDEVPMEIEYIDMINVHDVAQVDLLTDPGNTAIFGTRGANGVIVIFTKDGRFTPSAPVRFHIRNMMPLGYQNAVEFYAPKYDTPARRNSSNPDLRTTIHWQPIVQTDSLGIASFEFYTADETSSYSVVIEGLTYDGRIIRQEAALWRRE